jgi:hypothetical protein
MVPMAIQEGDIMNEVKDGLERHSVAVSTILLAASRKLLIYATDLPMVIQLSLYSGESYRKDRGRWISRQDILYILAGRFLFFSGEATKV